MCIFFVRWMISYGFVRQSKRALRDLTVHNIAILYTALQYGTVVQRNPGPRMLEQFMREREILYQIYSRGGVFFHSRVS